MSIALKDGESQKMQVVAWVRSSYNFDVIAHRVDSETPYVILRPKNAADDSQDVCMTDSEAEDMINRLQRALSILPSSK